MSLLLVRPEVLRRDRHEVLQPWPLGSWDGVRIKSREESHNGMCDFTEGLPRDLGVQVNAGVTCCRAVEGLTVLILAAFSFAGL